MCGCGPSDCQYCAGERLRRAATPQPGLEVETVQEASEEISRKLGGKGEGDFSSARTLAHNLEFVAMSKVRERESVPRSCISWSGSSSSPNWSSTSSSSSSPSISESSNCPSMA